jgi:hypothetical protein
VKRHACFYRGNALALDKKVGVVNVRICELFHRIYSDAGIPACSRDAQVSSSMRFMGAQAMGLTAKPLSSSLSLNPATQNPLT